MRNKKIYQSISQYSMTFVAIVIAILSTVSLIMMIYTVSIGIPLFIH